MVYRCVLCGGHANRIAALFSVDGHPVLAHSKANSDFGRDATPHESVSNTDWILPEELGPDYGDVSRYGNCAFGHHHRVCL